MMMNKNEQFPGSLINLFSYTNAQT